MRGLLFGGILLMALVGTTSWATAPLSQETESCLECHGMLHPGIVNDWMQSRHAEIRPAEAMSVKGLALKISSKDIPERLKKQAVGCAECHTLRPTDHKDTFEHNGYDIHVVVIPKDCATCHEEESSQFDGNMMAHAHGNLVNNQVYSLLARSINDTLSFENLKIINHGVDHLTDAESCLFCHGTRLGFKGLVVRETEQGEMTFPAIEGWPNQGVGRINLDGSRGACSACHTRHGFSIEMARKPHTCRECHVGPDVPAAKVYKASKHGNIYSTRHMAWNFASVPWTVGEDFTAPTCAACHMSLLVNDDEEVIVNRSHKVLDRLPFRIFGLIYAHPHPLDADTSVIKNQGGLPLPTDFKGGTAKKYLVDGAEGRRRRQAMQSVCLSCHDTSWVHGHWVRFENSIKVTNRMTLAATRIMTEIWDRGLATGPAQKGNPFDEYIEKIWCDNWLFYANSVRFASAMAGGGDFGVFADGRYQLSKNVRELLDWLHAKAKVK